MARSTETVSRCEPSVTGLEKDQPAGAVYVSTAVETVIATKEVPVKTLGTTTLVTDPPAIDFDMPANNRLRYIGTATKTFKISAAISMVSAVNGKFFNMYLYKNGSAITGAHVGRKIASGADEGALALNALVELSNGDYVETWVDDETDTTNCTFNHCMLTAVTAS